MTPTERNAALKSSIVEYEERAAVFLRMAKEARDNANAIRRALKKQETTT